MQQLKFYIATILVIAWTVLAAPTAHAEDLVLVHTGEHWIWYAPPSIYKAHGTSIARFYDYMDREFYQICSDWGYKPPRQQYYLYVNPQTGGGFATGDIAEIHRVTGQASPGIGIAYDAYFNVANGIDGYWAYALGTHESCNLLTGQISEGWPRDWWADDRSPFPAATAITVEDELGQHEVARYHSADVMKDPLCSMFKGLIEKHGWKFFANMFKQMQADGIHWTDIDGGRNPSPLLTNYVLAYMTIASETWLDDTVTGLVPGYDRETYHGIWAAWNKWKHRGGDRLLFLSGHWQRM